MTYSIELSKISLKQHKISERSCENIFANLEIKNAEEELTKAELAWEIDQIIQRKQLTPAKAAKAMGITSIQYSALIHRKLNGVSVECLMNFIASLEQDHWIYKNPKARASLLKGIRDAEEGHLHRLGSFAKYCQ